MSDRHPSSVNPNQASWKNDGRNEKASRNNHRPPSRILGTDNDRPKSYESKDAADGKTEGA